MQAAVAAVVVNINLQTIINSQQTIVFLMLITNFDSDYGLSIMDH